MRWWPLVLLLVACEVDEEQTSTVPPDFVRCGAGRLLCDRQGECSCVPWAYPGDAGAGA